MQTKTEDKRMNSTQINSRCTDSTSASGRSPTGCVGEGEKSQHIGVRPSEIRIHATQENNPEF